MGMDSTESYRRYRIATRPAPEVVPLPPRFRVRVRKGRLVRMVLGELLQLRGKLGVALSRPCVYGVFSSPLGGLRPREDRCVGCLRCTVQHPEVVQIHPNPERARLGQPLLRPEEVETILYEARTGRVPVRGAGYRGPFGGEGWDGLWLDMSEIVRPTRDGIHGREYISTQVDLGERPPFLRLDPAGRPVDPRPRVLPVALPLLFDPPPPGAGAVADVVAGAAAEFGTLAVLPLDAARSSWGPHLVPLVRGEEADRLAGLSAPPAMVEVEGWDRARFEEVRSRLPDSIVAVRVPASTDVTEVVRGGARVVHLVADRRGWSGGRFVADLILAAHEALVRAGVREEVTLIGSGGIVMAEHVAKAIACGLDAVAVDVPVWAALQGRFGPPGPDGADPSVTFPRFDPGWGVQRVQNLTASWRDQLLEVLGAMGMREVRRLRGELGRLMRQGDLEREAFGEVAGYAGT
jgi:hypothetical protein